MARLEEERRYVYKTFTCYGFITMREGKGCSEAAPASRRRMQMSKPISCIVELGKCMRESNPKNLSRRTFATALAGAGALAPLRAQAAPQNPPAAQKPRTPEEAPPFGETIAFKRKDMPARVEPFEMTEVRLLPGAFRRAQRCKCCLSRAVGRRSPSPQFSSECRTPFVRATARRMGEAGLRTARPFRRPLSFRMRTDVLIHRR